MAAEQQRYFARLAYQVRDAFKNGTVGLHEVGSRFIDRLKFITIVIGLLVALLRVGHYVRFELDGLEHYLESIECGLNGLAIQATAGYESVNFRSKANQASSTTAVESS